MCRCSPLAHRGCKYHIHVDGALFAQILPHLSPEASEIIPVHDFTYPVASISVSGHKMMGATARRGASGHPLSPFPPRLPDAVWCDHPPQAPHRTYRKPH